MNVSHLKTDREIYFYSWITFHLDSKLLYDVLYTDASTHFLRVGVIFSVSFLTYFSTKHLNCSWVFNGCSWVSSRCRLTCSLTWRLHMPGARQACCHGNRAEWCTSGLRGYPLSLSICTHPAEEESAVRRPGGGGRCERSRLSQPQSPYCCFSSASRLSASVPAHTRTHTKSHRKPSECDHAFDLFNHFLIGVGFIWVHTVKSQRSRLRNESHTDSGMKTDCSSCNFN